MLMATECGTIHSDFENLSIGDRGSHSAILKHCEFNNRDTFRGILQNGGTELPFTFVYVGMLNMNPRANVNFFYWSEFKEHYKELIGKEVDIEYTCLADMTLQMDYVLKSEKDDVYLDNDLE